MKHNKQQISFDFALLEFPVIVQQGKSEIARQAAQAAHVPVLDMQPAAYVPGSLDGPITNGQPNPADPDEQAQHAEECSAKQHREAEHFDMAEYMRQPENAPKLGKPFRGKSQIARDAARAANIPVIDGKTCEAKPLRAPFVAYVELDGPFSMQRPGEEEAPCWTVTSKDKAHEDLLVQRFDSLEVARIVAQETAALYRVPCLNEAMED